MPIEPSHARSKRWFAVRLSWKLLCATAVVGAVAAVIAIVGLKRIQTLNENLTQTVNFLSTNAKLASLLKRDLITVTRAERNMMLAQSEDGTKRFAGVVDEVLATMDSRLVELRGVVNEEDRHQLDLFAAQWAKWRENHHEVRRYTAINSELAYHYVYNIGAPIAAKCEAVLDLLIERNEQTMQAYRISGQKSYQDARSTLLAISIFGIFLSVAISFYTGQQVARRLSILTQHAEAIQSTGDLSKPTPDLGGDEVGSLAAAFDHMRQSLYEQKLSLSEHAVRLAELTKSLESKNREMEQFVYTVSHDLKSPLVSCKGLLGLLKEDVDEGDRDAVVDSIERLDQATDQLNQIIDDLLMLSRIGRKKPDLTEINVVRLVDELAEELDERIADANATIDVEGKMPTVMADESDCRRIFENLLTNALKYGTQVSAPTITIGGIKESGEIRFFVRDNGPGIDAKYHKRIFGLFQRLETDSPGTGLGLASVAKIMNMHGGRVWVESEVGEGATFWLAFPDRGSTNS